MVNEDERCILSILVGLLNDHAHTISAICPSFPTLVEYFDGTTDAVSSSYIEVTLTDNRKFRIIVEEMGKGIEE